MASLYAVGTDGEARRGWPSVRVLIHPQATGVQWTVVEVTWRGPNRYDKVVAGDRVSVGPDRSLREAWEEATYAAMMSVPAMS